jgi:signal peptidase II|tara:strand:+ start:2363 stop:2872 length:510 start_codon:yes stop_codon:yes gene_type:complete
MNFLIKKNTFLSLNNKNNLICSLIVIFIFFLDRLSKIKIINHQVNNNQIYINDYMNFELIWNNGIGFGLLSSNSSLVYNTISGIIGLIIIFIIYLMIKSKILDKILFSAVLGGALGNLYDRLTYFAVPDFIDIHYERFHWFTFNIADIFITIGILGLIGKDLFIKNEKF